MPFLCIVCGSLGAADLLLNVAFFVPLGLFVHLAAGRRRGLVLAVAAGLLLSALVEAGQLLVPGRYTTLGDLAANTAGAGLGGLAARWRAALLRPPPGRAALLSLGAGGATAAAFLLTGWLLTPSPTDGRNWVQWTPALGHYETYRGRVLAARLGELSLSPGRMETDRSEAARRAIRSGRPLAATVRTGPPPPGLASVVSLYDGEQRENVLLGLDGPDLVLRVRYRAADLDLSRPDLRLRGALAGVAPGDTVRLAGWRPLADAAAAGPRSRGGADGPRRVADADGERRETWCLAAGERRGCGLGFPPGRGWSLLEHPEGLAPAALRGLDAAWIALLFLPLGLWGVRRPPSAAGLALAAGGLLAAPALTPLVAPGAVEAAGAAVGLGIGLLAGRWARRRPRR